MVRIIEGRTLPHSCLEVHPRVVKRVDPLSSAKIAGTLYAILGLVFGALVSLGAVLGTFASDSAEGAAFGTLFGIGAIVLLPLFYGVLGFVTTLIMAWLYNVVSGMVGGVEFDVQ
jgi:hypothetical protein